MRVVFLGSPPFATPVLERLVASPHRPVAIVTKQDLPRGRGRRVQPSSVAGIARREEIELLQPEKATDPEFLDRLRALGADVFLAVAYGKILREEFLAIPRDVSLNVHPSLLPRWRGATPVQAALAAGDRTTGVTIQRVALELDAGDVLVALRTEVRDGETAGELQARMAELSCEAVIQALDLVAAGGAAYTPQDPGAATFCTKLDKEAGVIDWTRGADELERHVHAMNPWPGARTTLPGEGELIALRARASEGSGVAGTVLSAGRRFVVACGRGALELAEVKPAGKRAMAGDEYLRGARLEAGMMLGG